MDRAAFIAEMNDLLDGCADDAQAERLAQNLREDPSRRALAAEMHLQDDMLMELAGLKTTLPTSAQILLRAKKRARIIGFGGASSGTAGPVVPPAAPATPGPSSDAPKRRKGAARTERGERHRTGTRPHRPVRGQTEGIIKLISMVVGVAALVAIGVYLARDPGQSTTPDETIAKSPDKKPAPTPPKQKAPPTTLPKDPILSIVGGDFKREGNTLTTDRRSAVNVKLADGSEVELQPNTRVSFAVPSAEVRNELELARGRIKVQAAKDERTFRVRVGANRIEVVGTAFVVEAPDREHVLAGHTAPARIEVTEGVVRLKNDRGELLVEKGSAFINEAYKPQRIVDDRDPRFRGYSGFIKGRVVHKDRHQLIVRVMNADPDEENKLEGAANKLKEQVIRLFPAGAEAEGAHERAMHLLESVKVMDDPVVLVWMNEGRFMFTVKE